MSTTFIENLGIDNAQEALRERERERGQLNHLNEVFGYNKPSILENLRNLLPQFLKMSNNPKETNSPTPNPPAKEVREVYREVTNPKTKLPPKP